VFKLHRASRKIPVAHGEREIPLPIPNRAVKPLCADGTWGATPWESRSPPVLLQRPPFGAVFFMLESRPMTGQTDDAAVVRRGFEFFNAGDLDALVTEVF